MSTELNLLKEDFKNLSEAIRKELELLNSLVEKQEKFLASISIDKERE